MYFNPTLNLDFYKTESNKLKRGRALTLILKSIFFVLNLIPVFLPQVMSDHLV